MTYNPGIPQPADFLSDSQSQLLGNFNKLNVSFGVDHYRFADLTVNNGFHNQVTTPGYVTTPPSVPVVEPTTTANPIFYGFQPLDAGGVATTNLGLLQYSRGPTNAVPSPLTRLHSTAAAIVLAASATTNVLDFTGIPRAICQIHAFDGPTSQSYTASVVWTGSTFLINSYYAGSLLVANSAGAVLRIQNISGVTFNNVYWTLDLKRVS